MDDQNVNQEQNQTTPSQTQGESAGSATVQESGGTLMGVLSYLGIFIIIPFLMARNNPFVKFHIKQGLVLVVIWIVLMVLDAMLGWSFMEILDLVRLAVGVLAIIGIVNVFQRKEAELPLVGRFAKHFNI